MDAQTAASKVDRFMTGTPLVLGPIGATLRSVLRGCQSSGSTRVTEDRRASGYVDRDQLYASIQLSRCPVVMSRHMRSGTPLWSKSPTPTGTAPAGCDPRLTLADH